MISKHFLFNFELLSNPGEISKEIISKKRRAFNRSRGSDCLFDVILKNVSSHTHLNLSTINSLCMTEASLVYVNLYSLNEVYMGQKRWAIEKLMTQYSAYNGPLLTVNGTEFMECLLLYSSVFIIKNFMHPISAQKSLFGRDFQKGLHPTTCFQWLSMKGQKWDNAHLSVQRQQCPTKGHTLAR